jgi:hypothetical protein
MPPPPKEYHVLRKGRVEQVSRAQYYRIQAKSRDKDGANTRTSELQALLDARAQADTNAASTASPASASGKHLIVVCYSNASSGRTNQPFPIQDNHDDEDGDRNENGDTSMDIEKTVAGDEVSHGADWIPWSHLFKSGLYRWMKTMTSLGTTSMIMHLTLR